MSIFRLATKPLWAAALIVILLLGASPAYAAGWTVVSSPDASGSSADFLYGVAPVSSNDVWTVGNFIDSSGLYETLAEHWNGSGWSVVPTQKVSGINNYLGDAVAISSSDVWASGYTDDLFSEQTLLEHWNGSSWSIVPSPDPGGTGIGTYNFLGNMAAMSTNDVWAVGYYVAGGNEQTLTVHWDGSAWSWDSSPNTGTSSFLNGVTAVSSHDVWASGAYTDASGAQRTLIEHWNGTAWSIVPSPSLNTDELLVQMAAVSSTDVWAIGYSGTSDTTRHTLDEHWNGTAWSVISSPQPGAAYDGLNGIAVVSATNIWATGYQAGTNQVRHTLIEHWNGTSWSMVSSPNKGKGSNTLEGAATVPGMTTTWTAGFYYVGSTTSHTLIERHT